jgi:hypothetical protein
MPLPVGTTTITVTGQNLCNLSGTPASSGTVYFTASGQLADPTHGFIIVNVSVSSPVVNGVMTPIVLPVNDETVNPNGFTYTVRQELYYGSSVTPSLDVYSASLPHTLGSSVDLSSLSPVAPFTPLFGVSVLNASVLGSITGTGAPAIPTANWGFGLAMPVVNNNDNCNIGYYSCEGLVIGLQVYEHCSADSVRLINCFDGLVCFSSSGFPHRNHFKYVSIENCTQLIVLNGGFNKLDIDVADIEWTTGAIVKDVSTSPALGRIGITSNGNSGASLNTALSSGGTAVVVSNGPIALEITNLDQAVGAVTPPAVPGSTTALVNPFWRRADVHVSGGTVTQVAVDGVNQLSTSGSFTVPSGHSITLTYSSAPTWAWTLS